MSESILMALVQLFALVAAAGKHKLSSNAREILVSYLQRHLNSHEQEEYLKLFDELVFFHQPEMEEDVHVSEIVSKITRICDAVNRELKQRDKIIVFLKFVEFLEEGYADDPSHNLMQGQVPYVFYESIARSFNFNEKEFNDMLLFIFDPYSGRIKPSDLLVISAAASGSESIWMKRDLLDGRIRLLHLHSVQTFIGRYNGNDTLFLNGHNIFPERCFYFDNGDILRSQKVLPVYYSDIARTFRGVAEQVHITFTLKEVEYHFRNSRNGLQPLSLTAESGELVGVMGGSGVGKSTLLNILNGNIIPEKGKITINGHDLHTEQEALQGIIGFVPQDDLLIEELTVYQNLYYNARLCFDQLGEEKLRKLVLKTLGDIDLLDSKDLKVGDPLNKTISGGQRKRLNIALELVRQPSVLFADEPTSGLSSMDSDMVMTLLKEQTLAGRLVIVNIHQPSSDIFKLFDKILIMDKGGYPVYYGNPVEAVSYFKKIGNYVNPEESECLSCGYVNPEQVLQIIEAKLVNESGKTTMRRKNSPADWYGHFLKKIQPGLELKEEERPLPSSFLQIPPQRKQYVIFSIRNLLTKISNRQYMFITLLEAPLLAALLAFITRYHEGGGYVFGNNRNMVAYLFMSVVVSLFLGMMVSAEEIIRDRKLLKREAFLHLSRFSYLNSKISFLFFLSAIQAFLYVIVGNLILGISGMLFSYWMILFTTSCVACMIGLNVSAGMNSVVAIYITIPFLIVPQLLLSGTIVSFDQLNPLISSRKYVPVIGDAMPSRWSFEALAVDQFKNNRYEKIFYPYEQKISDYAYVTAYSIPHMQSMLDETTRDIQLGKVTPETGERIAIVQKEIRKLNPSAVVTPDIQQLHTTLDSLGRHYSAKLSSATAARDKTWEALAARLGTEEMARFRAANYNENVAELVLDRAGDTKVLEGKGELIRKKDPVYSIPECRHGRALLYSPVKRIGGLTMDTFWFNIAVLWLMSAFLYVLLLVNGVQRMVMWIQTVRLNRR